MKITITKLTMFFFFCYDKRVLTKILNVDIY